MKKAFEEPRFDVLVFGQEDIVVAASGVDEGSYTPETDLPVGEDD